MQEATITERTSTMMSRQSDIIAPAVIGRMNVIIIGCGSIGSVAAYSLACMGIPALTLVDYDEVSEENIFSSFYGEYQIGFPKPDALARTLNSMIGMDITTTPLLINIGEDGEDGLGNIGAHDIALLCTDNLESRLVAFDSLADRVTWFIDARIGGHFCSVYTVHSQDNERMTSHRGELLKSNVSLPCGSKATTPLTKGFVPGMIGKVIVDIINDRKPSYLQQYNLHDGQLLSGG